MKILIFGASGSGTTTLGNEVQKRKDFRHLDVDEYYWKDTNPPYQQKIPLAERNENLKVDFLRFDNVVVSGSLVSWGKEWHTSFDLAFFIKLENEERMERLRRREVERYGKMLLTDHKIKENSKAFLDWANQYEDPNFDGRSLKIHNDWSQMLDCKVIRIKGELEINKNLEIVCNEIEKFHDEITKRRRDN